ncbi:MAG: diphthamide synthesis protein [Candidatus Nanoarchaeia archaeon]|nr:diphthamide synthesis protein [Candidatus Nanoarchaeia archaeon]MDD5499929.1 diphthamide synthesis protein [Candidatus Nanoarchaeia archaeon]
MKIIYEPVRFNADSGRLLKAVKKYDGAFIAFTAQLSHVFKGLKNSGQVLGCNIGCLKNFKGNTIIFAGDGVFHALIIKKEFLDKKVFVLNPLDFSLREIRIEEVSKFIKRDAILLDKLRESKIVGIIISSKKGQERMALAEKIKKKLESEGKKAHLFLSDNVNPDEFLNFSGLDILVNTACPRIGIDDYAKFPVPIINCSLVLSYYFED